jgi:hypothetical protein
MWLARSSSLNQYENEQWHSLDGMTSPHFGHLRTFTLRQKPASCQEYTGVPPLRQPIRCQLGTMSKSYRQCYASFTGTHSAKDDKRHAARASAPKPTHRFSQVSTQQRLDHRSSPRTIQPQPEVVMLVSSICGCRSCDSGR